MLHHRNTQRPGLCVTTPPRQRVLVLVLLAAAALVVCGCAEQDSKDAVDALFLPYFDEYTAVTQREIVEDPYVRGKVVAYVPGESEMDSVYYSLAEELRAATPEEVGTVVRVGCSENVFGHYSDGTEAYQTVCSVLVIDWSLPAIIGQQTFKGAEPPSAKTLPGARHGYGRPDLDIAHWLESLPRRTLDSAGQPDGAPTQPGGTEPVAKSATPELTSTLTPALGSPGVDVVIAWNPGPGAKAQYAYPHEFLGDPDMVEQPCCQGMLQLGRGGSLVAVFTDNAIVDGLGPDFQVYGEGAKDDFVLVEVSEDGQVWHAYPKVAESSGPMDLADVGLVRAVFVRLTDVQPGTSTGAEVDALVALHSGPAEGTLPVLPDAAARAKLTLHESPSSSTKAVDTVMANAVLTVLRRSSTNEWVEVRAPSGKTGWCRIGELALNVSLSGYAAVQAPPAATRPPPTPAAARGCPSSPALVRVRNLLAEPFTLDLKGPGAYRLSIPLGQARNVCLIAGTYSFTLSAGGSNYETKSRTFDAGGRTCWSFSPSGADTPECDAPKDPGAYSPP